MNNDYSKTKIQKHRLSSFFSPTSLLSTFFHERIHLRTVKNWSTEFVAFAFCHTLFLTLEIRMYSIFNIRSLNNRCNRWNLTSGQTLLAFPLSLPFLALPIRFSHGVTRANQICSRFSDFLRFRHVPKNPFYYPPSLYLVVVRFAISAALNRIARSLSSPFVSPRCGI